MVERSLAASRERARALIMGHRVMVDGQTAVKPGQTIPTTARIVVKEDLLYVGRGGLKLEAALDHFGIDPRGMTVLDAGASTGGFTDCLLQRGAVRVIAVDVGYGQFHWRLRVDPRVLLLERTNLRHLDPMSLPFGPDAGVADLSFISLELVLPVFARIIPMGGWLLPLVKPQFEVGRKDVPKGGVVRDPAKIEAAIDKIEHTAEGAGFRVAGRTECPVKGPKGNRESFLHLVKEREPDN